MYILSSILNIDNGYFRRTRSAVESKASRKETCRLGTNIQRSKERSIECRDTRRLGKDNGSIRSKSKQRTLYLEAQRIRVYLSLIPLFIFYNPQLWTLLFIIDASFTDELITFNIIQLNSIVSNIQMFINRGSV